MPRRRSIGGIEGFLWSSNYRSVGFGTIRCSTTHPSQFELVILTSEFVELGVEIALHYRHPIL